MQLGAYCTRKDLIYKFGILIDKEHFRGPTAAEVGVGYHEIVRRQSLCRQDIKSSRTWSQGSPSAHLPKANSVIARATATRF